VSVFPADRNHVTINVGDVPAEVKSPRWITEEIRGRHGSVVLTAASVARRRDLIIGWPAPSG
jgi:hypothetical protein